MTVEMKRILPRTEVLWVKDRERVMSDIFAMRGANGDWFALENDGRLCVPIFHSTHDALMARLRTVEMLLFSPVALDTELLNEIVGGGVRSTFALLIIRSPA